RARDDLMDRDVAIKMPNPGRCAQPGYREMYMAEARALARLRHPHIVQAHDVGQTDEGLPFVVYSFIKGVNLHEKMKQGRMTVRQSAELVAVAADALHYVHRERLVHRDIKPANILIDHAGQPHLTDFGLALRDEDFGKGPEFAGTPRYMSPEQARG